MHQQKTHLKKETEIVTDFGRRKVVKAFGTVSAHKNKSLSRARKTELVLERATFPAKDERGLFGKLVLDLV
jgi:hypothetical protein